MIVWTRETGILPVAVADRRWPPTWKPARGRVVIRTSRVGYKIPIRRAGMCVFREGNIVESPESRPQNMATNPHWIRVSVAGFGKPVRIDFEEVFVQALDIYQMMHSI